MLKSLSLANFKSWKSIDRMRLAPITGLFGSNSSGKTSILQLLLMLKQTVESTDRAQVLNLGDDRSPIALGTFRDVVHRHKIPGSLRWSVEWGLPEELRIGDPKKRGAMLLAGTEMRFQAEVVEGREGQVAVKELLYHLGGHDVALRREEGKEEKYDLSTSLGKSHFKRERGRPWDLPPPVKCYGFPDQVRAYYQNTRFLADLELAFEELFTHIYYLGPLREYPKPEYRWGKGQPADVGQRGEHAVHALLASRENNMKIARGKGKKTLTVEEYVAFWLEKLGLIHNFSVEPVAEGSNLYQVWVQKHPEATRVRITDVGFGVSQILPVLVLCYYVPEGSTILLEQPEIHLHPSVQAGLADVFIDAIKTRQVQIILESHSEHLLRRLQRRVAEEEINPEDAALYFCAMEKSESHLTPLQLDMFGTITNWPEDFFGDEFGEIAATSQAALARKKRGVG